MRAIAEGASSTWHHSCSASNVSGGRPPRADPGVKTEGKEPVKPVLFGPFPSTSSIGLGESRGFTLVEVMISLALLATGFLGLAAFYVAGARSYDMTHEDTVVLHALRQVAEKMRGAPFASVSTLYQGYTFAVDGIQGTGSVTIYMNETDTSTDAQALGLPRDLDGDGMATHTNVSGGYLLLPAKISVTWQNPRGPQVRSLYLLLAQETS